MLDSSLKDLVTRIRSGDAAALETLADQLGPFFLKELLDRRQMLVPFAENLAIMCIHGAIERLEAERDCDPAAIIAQVLDRKFNEWFQAFQTDVKEASQLQTALFPKPIPPHTGLEIAARSRPLRPINGDLYDFIARPMDLLVVLVDASGKGTAAGLFGAIAGGFFRGYTSGTESPSELLALLDKAISGASTDSKYLTAILLSWRPAFRDVHVASAGLSAPLVSQNGLRKVLELQPGPLIGIDLPTGLVSENHSEISLSLSTGDWVAIFSDGITDQSSSTDQEYGVDRLWEVIQLNAKKSVDIIIDEVFADLDRHTGNTPRQDDQTLVLIRAAARDSDAAKQ